MVSLSEFLSIVIKIQFFISKKNIIAKIENSSFQFKITGRDRYIIDEKVYSSTYHTLVANTDITSPHISGDAVDLRIKVNNKPIPYDVGSSFNRALNKTRFILNPNAFIHTLSR